MTHTYHCPVRWGDMDAQGHINNAAFVDYLQETRVDFMHSGPPVMRDLLSDGVVVVSQQVEYLAPVIFTGIPLRVDLWIDALGASRFVIGYRVFDGETLAAQARVAVTPFDLGRNELRRLTSAEREFLSGHLDPADQLRDLSKITQGAITGSHYPLRVRWSDLDSYGHVNNVRYYDYIQEARIAKVIELLGDLGSGQWVVVRQDLDYLKPIDFSTEPYQVITGVAEIGTRSLTLAAEICDHAGLRYATGRTVMVAQHPISEQERAAFARWQIK